MKTFEGIMLPQLPRARVLLWADLTQNDMEVIEKNKSIPEIERSLCRALAIDVAQSKQGVLLELYTNLLLFCREQNFNREQTSVLISIFKNVHQFNTETPLNNMDQCFSYCSELLLCHSVRRPPFSIHLFGSEQVTNILKYYMNTYMRHYFLYKYIFTPEVRLDLSLSYIGVPEDIEKTVNIDGEKETERELKTDGKVKQNEASGELKTMETDIPKQVPLQSQLSSGL